MTTNEVPDYKTLPIAGLSECTEKALAPGGNLITAMEIGFEAESRLPRIPQHEGIFKSQRAELEAIVAAVATAVEQSKLTDEALHTRSMGMGY